METRNSTTTGRLAHPLPTRPDTPTNSGFGVRVHPVDGTRRMHYGIDIAVAGGTRVGAVDGGEVVFAGTQRNRAGNVTGAGNYVIVRHGTADTGFSYSAAFHLQDGSTAVQAGDRVTQGQALGRVGQTGTATGNHLHFEYFEGGNEALIRQGSIGGSGARRLDPGDYLGREYLGRITVREGDRNEAVRELQQDLRTRGYDLGTGGPNRDGVDGHFGDATQRAVVAFQRDRGLPPAQQQGVYGPITRREMAEAEREGWRRPGAPAAETARPETRPPAEAPRTETPPTAPTTGGATFRDTPGPYAAVSTGALLGTPTGTRLGALTGAQSYALGRAVFGDSVGAAALEAVDRRLGTGSGVFVQRMVALGQHEGGLDFGRRNADPRSGSNAGTFQVGGRGTTPQETEARFERLLDRGIRVYEGLAPGTTVDRSRLTIADRDVLAHLGHMTERSQAREGSETATLRAMADPNVRGADLVRLASTRVQGGIDAIGQDVVAMTDLQTGLRVDTARVEARRAEPDAVRREPSMPVLQPGLLRGTESPAVRAWQEVLVARGQTVGPNGPDGRYGPTTRTATEALQREAGLTARGVVGPATWDAYGGTGARTVGGAVAPAPITPGTTPPPANSAPTAPSVPLPPSPSGITQTLREGMRGPEVTLLQQHLRDSGYPDQLGRTGPDRDGADGVFGTRTRQAVEAFQRDNQIPVTGVLDRETNLAIPERDRTPTAPATTPTAPAQTVPGETPRVPSEPAPVVAPGPSGDGASSPLPVAPVPSGPSPFVSALRSVDAYTATLLDRMTADVPGALAALRAYADGAGPDLTAAGVRAALVGHDPAAGARWDAAENGAVRRGVEVGLEAWRANAALDPDAARQVAAEGVATRSPVGANSPAPPLSTPSLPTPGRAPTP